MFLVWEAINHVPAWVWAALLSVAYHLFVAFSAAFESPTAESSPQYRFWFRFLNRLAGNWKRSRLWKRGTEQIPGRRWTDSPTNCAGVVSLQSDLQLCIHAIRNLQTVLLHVVRLSDEKRVAIRSMTWSDWFRAALALVIWREARGEGRDGMRAVAHVIRNRVEATDLPDQWEDVIQAKWQFSSMTAPRDSQLIVWPRQPDPRFEEAMEIAQLVHDGDDFDLTASAHFYANLEIVPATSSFWKIVGDKEKHPQTAKIGRHTFFR